MKKTLLIALCALGFSASAQVQAPGTAEFTKSKLDKTSPAQWTATASSEFTSEGPASKLVDGNDGTYWVWNYGASTPPPYEIVVDMKAAKTIAGVYIRPRNASGETPRAITIQTSNDPSGPWINDMNIELAQNVSDQFFSFSAPITCQYYKITINTNYSSSGTQGTGGGGASLSETGAFETLTPDLTAYSRTTWTATGSTTQGTGGTGDYAGYVATVDNNASTYWHSQWSPATTLPQWLEFDMQSALLINKISLVNRPDNTSGSFKKFTVSYKLNSGDAWVQLPTSFSAPTTANPAQISIPLGVRITARYIRLDITEVASGNFAMLAEFRAHLDSTLPVELTSFTAKTNGSTVNLNWATASEQNASHFNITRSTDGTNFNTIGKLAAAGNSSSAKKYNFTDFTPANGINYYQLQQVDLDGTVAKFDVKQAKVSLNNTELVVVSTTPSTLTVTVKGSDAKTGTITITNTLGQKIASQNINLANGASTATINTNNAKGLLIVTLNTATQSLSKKIIK